MGSLGQACWAGALGIALIDASQCTPRPTSRLEHVLGIPMDKSPHLRVLILSALGLLIGKRAPSYGRFEFNLSCSLCLPSCPAGCVQYHLALKHICTSQTWPSMMCAADC